MDKKIKDDLHELLFGVRRSIRYHVKRQQFFDRLNGLTSFFNVIFGSAAVVALIKTNIEYVGVPAAALVTVLSSIDLVVGYSRKARVHERLACKFIDLDKEIISRNNIDLTESELAKFSAERLDIEADEPPVKVVLDSICHNEMCRAEGYKDPKEYVKLTRIQKWVAQFWDLGEDKIVKPGYPKL